MQSPACCLSSCWAVVMTLGSKVSRCVVTALQERCAMHVNSRENSKYAEKWAGAPDQSRVAARDRMAVEPPHTHKYPSNLATHASLGFILNAACPSDMTSAPCTSVTTVSCSASHEQANGSIAAPGQHLPPAPAAPPAQAPIWHGLLAGAAASVTSRLLTYPADTVKARLQVQGAHGFGGGGAAAARAYATTWRAFATVCCIARRECSQAGGLAWVRGWSWKGWRAGTRSPPLQNSAARLRATTMGVHAPRNTHPP